MSDTDKQGTVEQVVQISLAELHPFKGYGSMPRGQPYQVRDNDPVMKQIAATVRERGVRQPGLVRPDPEGGYEIVSGHRRFRACELAGIDTMPVIVRNLSNEEAVAELVQSNIQRENVLPSERAWAYKMYLEAAKKSAGRPAKNSPQIAANLRSDDEVAKTLGISGDTLRRVASLTVLVPALLDMVDDKQIGVSTAYELTALKADEQALLLDAMDSEQATPSLSQAQRLKQFSQRGELDAAVMRAIMSEEKKEVERVTLKGDTLRKYFPASYTPKRMEETITENLESDYVREQSVVDAGIIDDIVELMVETVCSTREYIRVGKEDRPAAVVKSRLLKLERKHLEYVLWCFRRNTTEVRNIRAYIRSALATLRPSCAMSLLVARRIILAANASARACS